MLNCFDLTGKTAFITGGSQGLGKGFAKAFAQSGANLFLVARSEDKLIKACEEMKSYGVECALAIADITDEDAIKNAVDACVARFGKIDALINNAAAGSSPVLLEDYPVPEWRKVMDTNITGMFIVAKQVGIQMIKQQSGKMVIVTSIAGKVFHPFNIPGAYETSKEALNALIRALAHDWAKHNINVNGIAPGYFLSEINQEFCEANPTAEKALSELTAMGRWGNPDEIGPLGVFLCSDAASYMQGSIVTMDGGRTFR